MPVIMSPSRTKAQPAPDLSADPGVRATAATGLVAVGIIHALEVQGQLSGAAWLTAGFCLLAVAAPACGLWLLARPGPLPWLFGGLLCLFTAFGYVLTRGTPMPGDAGDVGNWLEPLGVTALIVEVIVVILAGLVLAGRRPGDRDGRVPGT